MPSRTPATDAYFKTFRAATGTGVTHYDVAVFGDTPEMADELLHLVLAGPKRATAGLLRDFEGTGETMPHVGGHVVVLDGAGRPACVWRTTDVRVGPLLSCDARFAWDEGEGDRSLAWWLDGHRRFFARQAEREGWTLTEDEPVIFERFTLVWPLESADPA